MWKWNEDDNWKIMHGVDRKVARTQIISGSFLAV